MRKKTQPKTNEEDGDKFVGKLDSDGKPLHGTMHYADGHTAEGYFLDYEPHGEGVKLTYPDQSTTIGEFLLGRPLNAKKYKYKTGEILANWETFRQTFP